LLFWTRETKRLLREFSATVKGMRRWVFLNLRATGIEWVCWTTQTLTNRKEGEESDIEKGELSVL
jgi:hypothetical protein